MLAEGTRWKRLADPRLPTLAEGTTLRVIVRGTAICFVRSAGVLRAVEDHCPHQGKSFEGGKCEGGYLICPWHKMSFDPVTGRNRYAITNDVQVFPVEEIGGTVRIGLPYTSFSLFGFKLW